LKACQVILLILLVCNLFHGLWQDVNGRTARKPYGFGGAVVSVVVTALLFWVHVKAGAFSLLW
jgi:hypothetical protein